MENQYKIEQIKAELPNWIKKYKNIDISHFFSNIKKETNIDDVTNKIIAIGKYLNWFEKITIKGLTERDYITNDNLHTITIDRTILKLFNDINCELTLEELKYYLVCILKQIPYANLYTINIE